MAKDKNKDKKAIEAAKADKVLDVAVSSLEKRFGKGIIMTGKTTSFPEIGRIRSGSIGLDKALNGGHARGRVIEVYGPESSGKTTLALHAIAEAQKVGDTCAFIDAEHALDVYYATALGVNIEDLMISQPDYGEQVLEIADMLARTGVVKLIVIDSVAALTPRAEIEGEMGDHHVGSQARLMSQAMRKLAGVCHKNDVSIIFINQIRMKIGVMFGSPETTSGGNALKFYASQRLDIRRIEVLKEGDDKVGIRTRVKVVKNKVGPPFRTAEFNIVFGQGIDWARDLLDVATAMGIIDKSGAWYSYKTERLGQGVASASKFLADNLALAEEIRDLILNPPLPKPQEESDAVSASG